jgi:hypothetical protein
MTDVEECRVDFAVEEDSRFLMEDSAYRLTLAPDPSPIQENECEAVSSLQKGEGRLPGSDRCHSDRGGISQALKVG